jgi:uncharacterized iron-regulated membrane protein
VAATGVILQIQKLTGSDENDPDNVQVSSALTTATDPKFYASMVERAVVVARAQTANTPIVSITFLSGDAPKILVRLAGEPGQQITVDAGSGKLLSSEAFEPEPLMQRIHDGSILGDSGVVMGVLWGSALVVLTITGLWMFIDMYRRRVRVHGKRQLFW